MMWLVNKIGQEELKDIQDFDAFISKLTELVKNQKAITLHDKLGNGKTMIGFNYVSKLINEYQKEDWKLVTLDL